MILQLWDIFLVVIFFFFLVMGVLKGFLRSLTFFSAHLFSSALALVFAPSLTGLFNRYMGSHLVSHFPSFLLIYLLPMVLLTQLFRVMYKRNVLRNGTQISMPGRWGGLLAGLFLGSLFCFLFAWILLLQPLVSLDVVYSLGGVIFSQTARILQIFMRLYV